MKKQLLLSLLTIGSLAVANAAQINLKVVDSYGNPIAGVPAQLVTSQFTNVGSTDANGELVITCANNLMHKIKVSYNGTTAISPAYTSSGTGTTYQQFATSQLTIVAKSGNTPVANIGTSFVDHSNSWRNIGATDANGVKTIQIFGKDSTKVRANANGSYADSYATPFAYGQNDTVCFSNLAYVNLPGASMLVGSSWFTPNGRYLFPAKYLVKIAGNYTDSIDITGNTVNKVPCVIIVKDHNGNPIAGVPLRGGVGSAIQWHAAPTNANGITIDWSTNGANTTRMYEARVNVSLDSITKNTAASGGNIFTFQTSLLVAKLLDCNGNGIAGGHIRYGKGTQINSHFPNANGVNTNAAGINTAECFPGTFIMEMGINNGTETKSFTFTGTNCVIWNTTNVTSTWAGNLSYSSNPSGATSWFVKAGTPMLAGNYYFRFYTGNTHVVVPVTILPGCTQAVDCPYPQNATKTSPTGLENVLADAQFGFYPNPVVNVLTVTTTTKGAVRILAMDGKVVAQINAEAGVNTIDVAHLAPGTYVLMAEGRTEKIVKQ